MSRNELFDTETMDLASRVLEAARSKGIRLGCAESCTGGLIASALTAIPGSSDCFVGGVVSYWMSVKENLLGVNPEVIETFGVVSAQTACAMASGVVDALGCDVAVSTTGIAGPGGEEPGKPVGTVCIGISTPQGTHVITTCKGSSREEVRLLAVRAALTLLLEALEA